ncbi:uncharacterized protein [Eleutherodactylus coqui]|uniref:uncharacterized protein n=1 Tax=Eleutherodactylus coqui TaxID=57060 RepID=UPI003462E4F5
MMKEYEFCSRSLGKLQMTVDGLRSKANYGSKWKRPEYAEQIRKIKMEMKASKDRKKEILDTGGPMAERLRNQERFDASRDYAGLNALPAFSPADRKSAAGSSSSSSDEGEVRSQKPGEASQPLSQSSSQCSIPARQPEPALSSGSSTENGGTSTSEADTSGEDFTESSKGGCLRSETHRVKSPLDFSLFSFGDDSPPEDMYSRKKKKKKTVEVKPLGWEEACGN